MQKNKIYCYYKYCSKLFGKMRRETEFRRRCCWNCKKKYNVSGERENWILVMGLLKFLSCLYYQACSWSAQNAGECLKWKAIVAMALLKMGEKKKKKNCGNKVAKNEGKKMLHSQHFYNKLEVVSCYWFKFEPNTKITFLPQ